MLFINISLSIDWRDRRFHHRYDGVACGVLLPGAVADDRDLAAGLRDGRLLSGRKGRHA